ncbi:glycosyltransferase [Bacteroidales bacterium OttesenSCG-928-M11]|nr:glycosyltransferase [Bacteroidales bacterium OttesenSCG-928-M11]
MRAKNIAIVIKNFAKGGAEKQSFILADLLSDYYSIHYIVFNGENLNGNSIEFLENNPHVSLCLLKGNRFRKIKTLSDYLKENKIESIFSYLTGANFYAALAGRIANVPKIYPGLRNTQLPYPKLLSDRFITNNISTVAIANSYKAKEVFIKKGFKKDKVQVITNAYPNPASYRERVSKEIIDIISVGRFVDQKDYFTALQAIAEVRKKQNNIRFHIVGYGYRETDIRRWIKELNLEDIVSIYINPPNIPELLNNADIYLSTSLFEGTSNSIMEAMDTSLPIVATKVGDNDHLIEEGLSGYLLPCKDVIGISEKLSVLVADYSLRLRMGQQGNNILRTKFSVQTFVDQYQSLLNN